MTVVLAGSTTATQVLQVRNQYIINTAAAILRADSFLLFHSQGKDKSFISKKKKIGHSKLQICLILCNPVSVPTRSNRHIHMVYFFHAGDSAFTHFTHNFTQSSNPKDNVGIIGWLLR